MLPGLPPATSSITVSCVETGGDQYGNNILDAAEAQIFASNTSILATLANMTALAVSHLVLPFWLCLCSLCTCKTMCLYSFGALRVHLSM